MPFKSKQQSKFMYSQHPKIAKRWSDEMKESSGKKHPIKPLPKRVKGSKATPAKTRATAKKSVQSKRRTKGGK